MAITTVLSDERSAGVATDGNEKLPETRFSWSAAIAGSLVALSAALLLVEFGRGFGLTVLSAGRESVPPFLTPGAIYTFAALVLAFAAGGFVTGRLLQPAADVKTERFTSAAHGLVGWAIAVAALTGLAVAGAGPATRNIAEPQGLTGDYVGYWVDMLFRPAPGPSQAWLAGTQYAQANTGNASDATPQPQAPNPATVPSPDFPETSGAFANPPVSPQQQPPAQTPAPESEPAGTTLRNAPSGPVAPEDVRIPQTENDTAPSANITADKAEVAHILESGMPDEQGLSQYDKDRIAALIVQDAGLPLSSAQRRVDNAQTRIQADIAKSALLASGTREHASLWRALSLLFGAIAAMVLAMLARRRELAASDWPRYEPQ